MQDLPRIVNSIIVSGIYKTKSKFGISYDYIYIHFYYNLQNDNQTTESKLTLYIV